MQNEQLKKRLEVAISACESVGKALLSFRASKGLPEAKKQKDGQLKSPIDKSCEGWIIPLLESHFPEDSILSEERYTAEKKFILSPSYWLVDALDGTRSFYEGYDGFCVQLAFIENAEPKVAVVVAPVFDATYWAISGQGAHLRSNGKIQRLSAKPRSDSVITYIDNHLAKGRVAEILRSLGADKFFESGSIGLKICRVAEGKADVFLKAVEFKTWDTAPGDLILKEAGGKLTLWNGKAVDYSGRQLYFKNFIATSNVVLYKKALFEIKKYAAE